MIVFTYFFIALCLVPFLSRVILDSFARDFHKIDPEDRVIATIFGIFMACLWPLTALVAVMYKLTWAEEAK